MGPTAEVVFSRTVELGNLFVKPMSRKVFRAPGVRKSKVRNKDDGADPLAAGNEDDKGSSEESASCKFNEG